LDASWSLRSSILKEGETHMHDKGSKDKGTKNQKKKPKHTIKEKRQIKQEKKRQTTTTA
jgi:hypothetical protein